MRRAARRPPRREMLMSPNKENYSKKFSPFAIDIHGHIETRMMTKSKLELLFARVREWPTDPRPGTTVYFQRAVGTDRFLKFLNSRIHYRVIWGVITNTKMGGSPHPLPLRTVFSTNDVSSSTGRDGFRREQDPAGSSWTERSGKQKRILLILLTDFDGFANDVVQHEKEQSEVHHVQLSSQNVDEAFTYLRST